MLMFIDLVSYVGIKAPKWYAPFTGEKQDILESETDFLVSSVNMFN